MARTLWTLVFLGLTSACIAQNTPRPEPVGSVTGHVMCADTQRPARLAEVRLVRVPGKEDAKPDPKRPTMNDAAPSGDSIETGLDGAYTIRNVKPGTYYLVVDATGYLLPLSEFSRKDLADPSVELQARIAKTVHPIDVRPDNATREDVVLERGASVSGTVLYDDGSPAGRISVSVLSKGDDGKWAKVQFRYRANYGYTVTDDNGHYRVTGLPPGEYATEADLSVSDHTTTFGPMPGNPGTSLEVQMMKTRFSLPLYSGDVLRKPEAKAYSLGSGEVRAGADLVFPLAKLHKVAGQLVAKDGHVVNGGKIKLLYADDKSKMSEAEVQYADAAFHLEFVPEGEFVMKVSGAKDVTRVQVANEPGYTPPFHEESKTVKTYGSAEQPLLVTGDAQDVLVTVPEAKAAAAATPSK